MAARRSTTSHQARWIQGAGAESGPSTKSVPSAESRPSAESGPSAESRSLEFLGEEPLLIRIDGEPYLVVMRTPGGEREQAVGFCLGEGIVDSPDDIATIGFDDLVDPNVIDLWLRPERLARVRELLGRKRFVSQTSCGICGKQLIEDLHQDLTPAKDGFTVGIDRLFGCLAALDETQEYYETTRASHAALLFDERAKLMCFAEDVGRHNALDKAIGLAFLARRLPDARIAVLSSRNSYELIQKTARARIPILVSKSRPTALAVALGKSLNMTLAFPDKSRLVVVCGESRILLGTTP